VQKSDRDRSDNAQRNEDEECYAHANRQGVGKRGLTGWDSHEPGEPFVEFHSMSLFRYIDGNGSMGVPNSTPRRNYEQQQAGWPIFSF